MCKDYHCIAVDVSMNLHMVADRDIGLVDKRMEEDRSLIDRLRTIDVACLCCLRMACHDKVASFIVCHGTA